MTKETLLVQYQPECRNALKSVVNISKSFQKVFMDAIKLFMTIPDRINFLQMGRYGCFSKLTYQNYFENDDFDCFSFNEAFIRNHPKGGRKVTDWYSSHLISIQKHLKRVSNTVVCDAFLSKAAFIKPLCENGFHVISRFGNLFYHTLENRTGKCGCPKLYDGKIDFENPDITRCTEYKVNKGKLYGLKAYSKALKRFVCMAVWYPMDGRTDKWQLYFSTDEIQNAQDVPDFYRTRL